MLRSARFIGVATIIVSKWENEFDGERAARVLNGEIDVEDNEPLLSEDKVLAAG